MMYTEILKKNRKEDNFKLYAYSLLPNHIHLLISPSQKATISEIMHRLNTSYSRAFNSAHLRRGHLFRERFKACLVEKDTYLVRLTAYIHLNPIKLGFLDNPEEYPYSSYYAYRQGGADLEQEVKEVIARLEDETYYQYLKRIATESSLDLHKQLRRGMLGSKEFVHKMKELLKERKEETQDVVSQASFVRRLVFLGGSIIIVALFGAIAGVRYFIKKQNAASTVNITPKIEELRDLDATEWQIKMVSMAGKETRADTLTFIDGKFISAFSHSLGYASSNYSIAKEDSRIVWKTLQSSDSASASWRAEVENGKMQGIVSLREGEKTRDFSFMSIGYRRRR